MALAEFFAEKHIAGSTKNNLKMGANFSRQKW
jgi:hypothetical protein